MNTRQIRNPVGNDLIEAEVIEIVDEKNEAVIIQLKDGAILRVKMDIAEVRRISNIVNDIGEPMYNVQLANTVILLNPPNNNSTKERGI